jgi:hypothetical protein
MKGGQFGPLGGQYASARPSGQFIATIKITPGLEHARLDQQLDVVRATLDGCQAEKGLWALPQT